jgi:hypothetical protein
VHLPENAGKVVRVSAVYMPHTVLTTESGRIFVFRQNDSGQLNGWSADAYENGSNPAEAHTKPVESSSMAH